MDKLQKLIKEQADVVSLKNMECVESHITEICEKHIVPPIIGRITKAKLRKRGIDSIAFSVEGFLGVIQNGYIIGIDGNKTKLK